MTEPESTISSVRSNVSDASSGYAFVSVPSKQRSAIKDVYLPEPPPDYEPASPVHREPNAQTTLLIKPTPTKPTCQSSRPLLTPEKQQDQVNSQPRTIFRINSSDINIEIVTQSPNSDNTDSVFFPDRKHEGCCATCNCSKSTKVKCMFVLLLIMAAALILVIVNFTACIGDVTSACK